MRSCARTLTAAIAVAGFTGCIPPSTFQTPDLLQPGESIRGIGLSGYVMVPDQDVRGRLLDLYFRWGLVPGLEVGLRGTAALPPGALIATADARYQVLREPLLASAGMGLSISRTEWEHLVATPTFIMGTERVYGGAKLVLSPLQRSEGVLAGVALGGRSKLLLEVNVYDLRQPWVTAGLALQTRLAPGE